MDTELRRVSSPDDWSAYHTLRETVLWTRLIDLPPYDRSHPDETADGHFPFLFVVDNEGIGTIRVDVEPPVAWFRLVAIRDDYQGRGLGKRMLDLATDFAKARGCSIIRCNAERDAVGFYETIGFRPIGDSAVNLVKTL